MPSSAATPPPITPATGAPSRAAMIQTMPRIIPIMTDVLLVLKRQNVPCQTYFTSRWSNILTVRSTNSAMKITETTIDVTASGFEVFSN